MKAEVLSVFKNVNNAGQIWNGMNVWLIFWNFCDWSNCLGWSWLYCHSSLHNPLNQNFNASSDDSCCLHMIHEAIILKNPYSKGWDLYDCSWVTHIKCVGRFYSGSEEKFFHRIAFCNHWSQPAYWPLDGCTQNRHESTLWFNNFVMVFLKPVKN